MGVYVQIKQAEKLAFREEITATHRTMTSVEVDAAITVESEYEASNLMVQYALLFISEKGAAPDVTWIFGRKLRTMIAKWAHEVTTDNATHPWRKDARQYSALEERIRHITGRQERRDIIQDLKAVEWNLGVCYMREVKVVFCTLSTSAHPLLVATFKSTALIIDEAAHEFLAGFATVFGAFKDHIKHVIFAGDHEQGEGFFAAHDSNVGHGMISRNLFHELFDDSRQLHTAVRLNESYRVLPELFEFVKKFYDGDDLKAQGSPQGDRKGATGCAQVSLGRSPARNVQELYPPGRA
jgi:hypothetical protein